MLFLPDWYQIYIKYVLLTITYYCSNREVKKSYPYLLPSPLFIRFFNNKETTSYTCICLKRLLLSRTLWYKAYLCVRLDYYI